MDKLKKVKKKGKKFEPQIFEQNFPVQDLNFEGDQINSDVTLTPTDGRWR